MDILALFTAGNVASHLLGFTSCSRFNGQVRINETARAHPDRYFEMIITEPQPIATATGPAARGQKPFASPFAAFRTYAYDFIGMGPSRARRSALWALTRASRSGRTARPRWPSRTLQCSEPSTARRCCTRAMRRPLPISSRGWSTSTASSACAGLAGRNRSCTTAVRPSRWAARRRCGRATTTWSL